MSEQETGNTTAVTAAQMPLPIQMWAVLRKRNGGRNEPFDDDELRDIADELAALAPAPLVDPQKPGTITGYKQHDQYSIDAVNQVKNTENLLGDLVEAMRRDASHGLLPLDFEMCSDAVRQIQIGYMLLVRSIFQPESRLKP